MRVTLIFSAVMALVLVATGAFLYLRMRSELDSQIDDGLHSRLSALVTVIKVSDVGLGESARSILHDRRGGFTQVLTAHGRLYEPGRQQGPAVLGSGDVARADRGLVVIDRSGLPGLGQEPFRLAARPIVYERQPLIVVAGASLADRNHALNSLLELLLIGGPIALVLASLAAYGTVAAALRPVEAMRARAAEISDTDSEQRLPVPPAQDELQRLGATLNAMLDRLEAAFARERAFVDDASHELRTPLALHKTELELALRYGQSADELRASIASAIDEVDRLVQLAEGLLVLARADKDKLAIDARSLEVSSLFASVEERLAGAAREAERELVIDQPNGARVRADGPRIEQALGNLVENALRHGEGPVRLWARERNGKIELHVSDSGPGFPLEFLPHAFERFRRASGERGSDGAGLGLAIVEAIAKAHGGQAGAANSPQGGADVWIELSRAG